MRAPALVLTGILCLPLAAQELVVNYLGGVRESSGFNALIAERAAIGVSPDGRLLYVTQGSRGVVLRYDLRARTVERIPVPGLVEEFSTQSVTGIAVNDDGTALVPLGSRIARLELDGKVTIPGIAFTTQSIPYLPLVLQAVVHPNNGVDRNTITGVYGNRSFWTVHSRGTSLVGSIQSCSADRCDNSTLPPDSQTQSFQAARPWGLALGSVVTNNSLTLAYFTDPESRVGFNSFGVVAVVRMLGTVTVLGHPNLVAIPMGISGARLARPTGIVLDPGGNLLVADTGNHRILRRTPAGVWSVFAGTGIRGGGGDGGPAINAELFEPKSLAIDASGTVYVHDSGNGFLRRILPGGVIERINTGQTQTETPIQDLPLPEITSLATDEAGQIYVASQNRIVRVDARGRATYVAGTGERGIGNDGARASESPLFLSKGLAVDTQGRVIFSDFLRIRRVEPSGLLYTIAGNGRRKDVNRSSDDPDPVAALSAVLEPSSLSLAKDGSLLITDGTWLRRFRDGQITSVTGLPWCRGYADGIPAIFACSDYNAEPFTTGDGRIVLAHESGKTLRVIDAEGFVATWARLQGLQIASMAPGPNGSVYALVNRPRSTASQAFNLLLRISPTGQAVRLSIDTRTWPPPPLRPGQPSGELVLHDSGPMASDSRGFLYLTDSTTRRIIVVGEPSAVEIDTQPSGLRVMVDGASVVTPRTFRWLPGEYHTVQAESQPDGPVFAGWSHGQGTSVTWMPPGGGSRVVARYGSDTTPVISQNGVVDAAAFQGVLSNWGWSTIFGRNLASQTVTWDGAIVNGKLPTLLGGTGIAIDGQPAYLSYVSPTQINFLTPPVFTGPSVSATLQLRNAAGTVNALVSGSSNVAQLFGYAAGTQQRLWAFLDGGVTLAAPPGAIAGLTSRPARPGETLTIYFTGGVTTNPAATPGELLPAPLPCSSGGPQVVLDDNPVAPDYCGMISPGVFQINFRLPDFTGERDVSLRLDTGSALSVARLLRVAP